MRVKGKVQKFYFLTGLPADSYTNESLRITVVCLRFNSVIGVDDESEKESSYNDLPKISVPHIE